MSDEPQVITEEQGVHKQWYEDARKIQNAAELGAFVMKLTTEYRHDYGTICHAMAAAAVGAVYALENSPTGGITGFQAGCVMWEFCRHWMRWGDEPRRLLDYDHLLFPQYESHFTTITQDIWQWARKRAQTLLDQKKDGSVAPRVADHWQSVADGVVPFGLQVVDR